MFSLIPSSLTYCGEFPIVFIIPEPLHILGSIDGQLTIGHGKSFKSDMSNSIETRIDIDFFGGIDIALTLILAIPEKLSLALTLIFLNLKDCHWR